MKRVLSIMLILTAVSLIFASPPELNQGNSSPSVYAYNIDADNSTFTAFDYATITPELQANSTPVLTIEVGKEATCAGFEGYNKSYSLLITKYTVNPYFITLNNKARLYNQNRKLTSNKNRMSFDNSFNRWV